MNEDIVKYVENGLVKISKLYGLAKKTPGWKWVIARAAMTMTVLKRRTVQLERMSIKMGSRDSYCMVEDVEVAIEWAAMHHAQPLPESPTVEGLVRLGFKVVRGLVVPHSFPDDDNNANISDVPPTTASTSTIPIAASTTPTAMG